MTRTRRWLKVSLLLLIAGLVLGVGVYQTWLRTPPPMPQTLEEAVALVSSPRFERLGESQKQRYFDRVGELTESMEPEARREAMRSLMRDDQNREAARTLFEQRMFARATAYVQAGPAERTAMLDQMIALQQTFSGNRGGQGPRENASGGTPPTDEERAQRRAERRAWMQNRIEQGNPQKQAYMAEFMRDLNQRRAELGLEPIHRGGRGG